MRNKTVITKQGHQFQIDAREVPPVSTSPGYRMEFLVGSPMEKCVVFTLVYQAVLVLAPEESRFDPIDWLWEKGCEMIQGAAETNSLEGGDYVIFERHIRVSNQLSHNQLSIDQLEKRA